jgi:hypothetical protein
MPSAGNAPHPRCSVEVSIMMIALSSWGLVEFVSPARSHRADR